MKDFLKKVLGKDEKFYELLEASADEAQKSAKSLSKLYAQVGKPDFEQCFTELVVARRVDKRIGLSITQELCKTFVTPLEREDIEALANALYKIPKTCEKIGERLAICPSQFSVDIVDKQVRMLEQATEVTARLKRRTRSCRWLRPARPGRPWRPRRQRGVQRYAARVPDAQRRAGDRRPLPLSPSATRPSRRN